jgi:hypothetical protein
MGNVFFITASQNLTANFNEKENLKHNLISVQQSELQSTALNRKFVTALIVSILISNMARYTID